MSIATLSHSARQKPLAGFVVLLGLAVAWTAAPPAAAVDFPISDVGPPADPLFDAINPDSAYNPNLRQYLVVWHGDDNQNGLSDNEYEIIGQRIDAVTGLEVAANDFRITHMGPDGNVNFGAFDPAVAFNPQSDLYLVAWTGDTNTGGLVEAELEIWCQMLDELGALVGAPFRISAAGGTGSATYATFFPAVAYNATDDLFLVVWSQDHDAGGQVNDEFEIWGRLVDGTTGAVSGSPFRISDMGTDGSVLYGPGNPRAAYNSTNNEFLVVWAADDDTGGLVNDEFEIFGQRLAGATGAQLGTNDLRISDAGDTGTPTFVAFLADVAWSSRRNEYLVVWAADENIAPLTNDEFEIFGQRLAGSDAAALGANDFRISFIGLDGNAAHQAGRPRVGYNSLADEWEVSWVADDPTTGNDRYEVWSNAVTAGGTLVLADDLRISRNVEGFPAGHGFNFNETVHADGLGSSLAVWTVGRNYSGNDGEFDVFGASFKTPGVFVDGFESGNTSAWALAVP